MECQGHHVFLCLSAMAPMCTLAVLGQAVPVHPPPPPSEAPAAFLSAQPILCAAGRHPVDHVGPDVCWFVVEVLECTVVHQAPCAPPTSSPPTTPAPTASCTASWPATPLGSPCKMPPQPVRLPCHPDDLPHHLVCPVGLLVLSLGGLCQLPSPCNL